jgi:hypothetical protein
MRRINSSHLSLGMSAVALFVALGGTAVAIGQIGTSQIKNGAVTNAKLHDQAVGPAKLAPGAVTNSKLANNAVTGPKLANNAVTGSKLANNAVTSAKIADGSLTAADVAPNTFLSAGGVAANSLELGGVPAGQYLQGRGSMVFRRVSLPAGSAPFTFLFLGFGEIQGTCTAGGVPKIRYVSDVASVNLIDTVTNFGAGTGTTEVNTTNGLTTTGFYEEPHNNTTPQSITWQASYTDASQVDHVATAWTSGQDIGLTSCIFIGQGLTTG